jgi:tRNA pseudouridine32 synthase/23S rRNA pseudouridine746 synthase
MSELDQLAIIPATNEAWGLLYQDDDLLIVNKPARLLTVPGRHPANRDCLISRVQLEFPQAQVVHRLDYDTSGLLVLPLNKQALSNISKQFQARTVDKTYQALVSGELTGSGRIDLPIAADPARRPLYKICQTDGKPSTTLYQSLHYDKQLQQSRLDLSPVTGRSHQLRLHLASIGHAILGDEFYASPAVQQASARLCLHARLIKLQHPRDGRVLQFCCDVPF